MNQKLNRLADQSSPYLLQHASNPVDWYPWGPDAFDKAKVEGKLLLISIGYSSCHWCHVMERNVFSHPDVAEVMNRYFVSVKVDREERPDVDQIYLNAVQIINRSGGWPLNCFAMPDGRPVFGGTYFPKEDWLNVLEGLNATWRNEPERVEGVAQELTQGIRASEMVFEKRPLANPNKQDLESYVAEWIKLIDNRYGGTKGAPKFPMPGSLAFLQTYANSEELSAYVDLSLRKIALGGIYDHLGGGFFRYSTDDRWEVPHFEKMLYDNAQMLTLYSAAYRYTPSPLYKSIVYQTVEFLRREMQSPTGGYYSAIDADSDGGEGRFYTWTKPEVDELLGSDAELFAIAHGVSASGNFEERNVLHRAASDGEVACVLHIGSDEVTAKMENAKSVLFEARAGRNRPITDHKHILAWNALLAKGLADAYIAFNDDHFLTLSVDTVRFIEKNHMEPNGHLKRIYCEGKASIPGFLDDYAYLVQAYLTIYSATFNEEWIEKAHRLTLLALDLFSDPLSGMMFYSQTDHNHLVARKMLLTDGVTPSPTAIMAQNLLALSVYYANDGYEMKAKQMLANMQSELQRGGPFVCQWAMLYQQVLSGAALVQTAGPNAEGTLKRIVSEGKHPFILPYINGSSSSLPIHQPDAEPNKVSLCVGKACQESTGNVDEILKKLENS